MVDRNLCEVEVPGSLFWFLVLSAAGSKRVNSFASSWSNIKEPLALVNEDMAIQHKSGPTWASLTWI